MSNISGAKRVFKFLEEVAHSNSSYEFDDIQQKIYQFNFKKSYLLENIKKTKQQIKLQNEILVLYESELDKINLDIQYVQMMVMGYTSNQVDPTQSSPNQGDHNQPAKLMMEK
jgi:hypothetical protein